MPWSSTNTGPQYWSTAANTGPTVSPVPDLTTQILPFPPCGPQPHPEASKPPQVSPVPDLRIQILTRPAEELPKAQQDADRGRQGATATPQPVEVSLPAQSLDQEFEQDGKIEIINKEEETTDDDVPREGHECYDTLERETVSHADSKVPDVRAHEIKHGDDIKAQDLTGSKTSSTNLGEKTPTNEVNTVQGTPTKHLRAALR